MYAPHAAARFARGFVLFAVVAASAARAQNTAADYARADSLNDRVKNRVFRASVAPHWIGGDSARFWYRNDLPDERRAFVLVDAEKATKQPAFDHARMAAALSPVLKRPVEADRLPIEQIAFDGAGKTVTVQVEGAAYVVNRDSYALRPAEAPLRASDALAPQNVPPSRNGGEDTSLTFVNTLAEDVLLYWIDTDGQRREYGTIRAGDTKVQHTFVGHSWLVVDKDGRPRVAFVATGDAGRRAVIDNNPPRADGPPRRLGNGRGNAGGRGNVSPDGKWQVALRDNNVWLRALPDGAETALTMDGTAEDGYEGRVVWSPDSRRFVVFKTVPAEEHPVPLIASSPRDRVQPRLQTFDYLKPGDRIARPRPHLFDVETKKNLAIADDLFPNPWSLTDVQWEPDGSRFTFLFNQRGHQLLRLIGVDARSGAATVLIEERSPTFIDYTNKVFLRRLDATGEAIWMSEWSGWNHLYLWDTRTGRLKNAITRGDWVVRGVDRVDPVRRQIWFRAGSIRPGQDPYYVHTCRVNFDGTGLTILTEGDGTHRVDYSPDERFFVDTYSRVDLPPVTELRRTVDGAKILDLERGDASELLATGWRFPERFVAKGRDGRTDIYGVIVRPTNFDPAKKYPVIENIYAGPQGAFTPTAFAPTSGMQTLAELGFIVVQMDGMGTNWRSKAFHDVCWKNLGDAGFPDRIAWIRAAAARHPEMDITRVGIYGTSAGGQSALGALLLHGDFYTAAVSDSGCHDNRMDKIWWNEQWMGWPVGPEYAAQSNVTLAPNLTGKLLLMVGELDRNVDPASTMQVVDALIRANKDFELLVLPGGGHGVAGTPYGRHRLQDFFVRHLLGAAPPDRNAAKPPSSAAATKASRAP